MCPQNCTYAKVGGHAHNGIPKARIEQFLLRKEQLYLSIDQQTALFVSAVRRLVNAIYSTFSRWYCLS